MGDFDRVLSFAGFARSCHLVERQSLDTRVRSSETLSFQPETHALHIARALGLAVQRSTVAHRSTRHPLNLPRLDLIPWQCTRYQVEARKVQRMPCTSMR